MSALDFYEEAYLGQIEAPVTNPLRYQARLLAGRSREEAFTSHGGPESMVAAILPDSEAWAVPGRGVDGSAH